MEKSQADVFKNIGIFGGTFDPIHLGHISLAFDIMEARHLDEIWFCPAFVNPLKSHQKAPISAEHRLKMLHLAIEGQPRFKINDIELKLHEPSFTVNTLRSLVEKEQTKGSPCKFFLIIGEDAARDFHKWREPEEIISLATILIGKRSSLHKDEFWQGSPTVIEALEKGITPTRIMEISSSEIRERLSKKKYCGHLLQRKVLDYIILNDLYS